MKNYKGPTPSATPLSPLFWARIVGTTPAGSKWGRDDTSPVAAYGGSCMLAREVITYDNANRPLLRKEAFRLTLTDAIEIEYSDDALEPFGGPQGYGPASGANTSVNELESAAIGVAAGAPVQILGANANRQRGVTVQNVGTTVLAISRDGGPGGLLLSPGAAANDGTGAAITLEGWTGPVFAANVAGGPGSVRVSAY